MTDKIKITRETLVEFTYNPSEKVIQQILENQESTNQLEACRELSQEHYDNYVKELKNLKDLNLKLSKGLGETMGSNFALSHIKQYLAEQLERIETQTNESFSDNHKLRNIKVILHEKDDFILELAKRKKIL